jgi:hypothetical protein
MRLFHGHGWPGCRKCRSNFRRTTDGTPLIQEQIPSLPRAPARVAPTLALLQEIADALTTAMSIGAGISCFDDEISVIDAGPPLHRCNFFLRPCSLFLHRCNLLLHRCNRSRHPLQLFPATFQLGLSLPQVEGTTASGPAQP